MWMPLYNVLNKFIKPSSQHLHCTQEKPTDKAESVTCYCRRIPEASPTEGILEIPRDKKTWGFTVNKINWLFWYLLNKRLHPLT